MHESEPTLRAGRVELSERDIHNLHSKFRNVDPFPHVVLEREQVEQVLGADLLQQLAHDFPVFEPENARDDYGNLNGKAVHTDVRDLGSAYRDLDVIIQSQGFLDLISRITGIPHLLYDPDYVGGGTHENLTGTELNYHIDFNYHPARKWHRRLNLILFLNEQWEAAWGGVLQLHRDAWEDSGTPDAEVVPAFGRAVIFETSERSWHGFEAVAAAPDGSVLSRRSIALYFYTENRPLDEVFPEHGTHYTGRPLPAWCQPGNELNSTQIDQLQEMLDERDVGLRFLYSRELEWSGQMGELREEVNALRLRISALESSRAYRLGRLLTAPARLLRRD
jgi:hypothetical protein